VTGREIEEDGDAVDLLLASDAWGLGDELERVWALVGGRREGGVRERELSQILARFASGISKSSIQERTRSAL
jgi:hypothetical protein